MFYTQFKHGCSICRFEQASDLTELEVKFHFFNYFHRWEIFVNFIFYFWTINQMHVKHHTWISHKLFGPSICFGPATTSIYGNKM